MAAPLSTTLGGSTAIVTGASRGIGLAVASALTAAGARVVLAARTRDELRRAAASLAPAGDVAAIPAVVCSAEDARRLVAAAEDRFGPADLLVNNAATFDAVGRLWEVDPAAWWRDVETSVRGAFNCSRAVLPGMVARGRGRIVNVTSFAAARPSPLMSGYGAAKAALAHLTSSLAEEARTHGVAAFGLVPGTVRTQMTERLLATPDGRRCLGRTDPDRWVGPERAGELVVLLASGTADSLSGRLLHVLDDVADLARRADEVEREDLLALRLRGPAA
jgi:NAD(P)-dependent dehydrogenase (short-subunit alcohol dehydrogenase family)